MNISELRAELGRHNISIPKFAKMIGIGKKAIYERMNGDTEFKQSEISKATEVLGLSDERMLEIFFSKKVS